MPLHRFLYIALALSLTLGMREASAQAAPEPPKPLPIPWQTWGPEAFALAKKSNKPILLCIHAGWSSNGAALLRELAADADSAALVGEVFIPVLVDRDRFPDVDRRYQEAARAMRRPAGWPLCMFLTPDGLAFWGGMYSSLDLDELRRTSGFRADLKMMYVAWHDHLEKVTERALAAEEGLRLAAKELPEERPSAADVRKEISESELALLSHAPTGPRFPQPLAWRLLIVRNARGEGPQDLKTAARTAAALADSGVCDQLGGGFHRMGASGWRIPRFEKLLSANAELLILYTELYQATGEARFAHAAEGILRWLDERMCDKEHGGFYASESAAAPDGEDGAYYTWSVAELEAAIDSRPARALAREYFDVGEWGELSETAPHRNVLFLAKPLADALPKGVAQENGPELLEQAVKALRAARAKRPAPSLDRGILVDANARAVSAVMRASIVLGNTRLKDFALKTLERLIEEGIDPERGAAHVLEPDGKKRFSELAADEAALAIAAQDAYLATGDPRQLQVARAALARLDKRFLDPEDGAYTDRAREPATPPLGRLGDIHKPGDDSSIAGPSVNALATEANLRHAVLSGEEIYADRAKKALAWFAPRLGDFGAGAAGLLLAQDAAERGLTLVAVRGKADDERTRALLAAARETYAPHVMILRLDPGDKSAPESWGLPAQPDDAAVPKAAVVVGPKRVGATPDPTTLRDLLEHAGR